MYYQNNNHNRNNLSNLGRDIDRMVRDAVDGFSHARSFDDIKRSVDATIREVTDVVKSGAKPPVGPGPFPGQVPPPPPPAQNQNPNWNRAAGPQGWGQPQPQQQPYRQQAYRVENAGSPRPAPSYRGPVHFASPSKAKGVLPIVLGGAFGAIFLCVTLLSMLAMTFGAPEIAPVFGVFGVFTLGCAGLVAYGVREQKLLKRFRKYCSVIGTAPFCPVEQLAAYSGIQKGKVVRDLQLMIRRGWFPNGKLDPANSTLMLDAATYQQYLQAEKARQEREKREAEQNAPVHTGSKELDEAIEEGRAFIRRINQANEAIPGEEVSRKISELEDIAAHIFAAVEHNPEKLSEIRRFMNYYLPTTLKLLDAYREFDMQPAQGENILKAKKEIEDTLDTIAVAFRNLLDSLYEKDAIDISADISVLQAMFAREGLTGSDFKKAKAASQEKPIELDLEQKEKDPIELKL